MIIFIDMFRFFYYEEIDWATRAKPQFSLGYAPMSIVYHKEGASLGSKSSISLVERRFHSEYFLIKNCLKFTMQYFPYAIPTIYIGFFFTFMVRLLRGQLSRAILMLKVLFGKDVPKVN